MLYKFQISLKKKVIWNLYNIVQHDYSYQFMDISDFLVTCKKKWLKWLDGSPGDTWAHFRSQEQSKHTCKMVVWCILWLFTYVCASLEHGVRVTMFSVKAMTQCLGITVGPGNVSVCACTACGPIGLSDPTSVTFGCNLWRTPAPFGISLPSELSSNRNGSLSSSYL